MRIVWAVVMSILCLTPTVWAGSVIVPNTFTANTPAVAAQVNANFTAVKTAVNDNDARIGGNTVAIASKGLLKVTVLNADCPVAAVNPAAITYTKVGNIGSFIKTSATSTVEVAFHGRLAVGTSIALTGVNFELRVDNVATTNGRARAVLKAAEVGLDGIQASITGIFSGLAIGTHTVDMYVGGTLSSAVGAMWDPGCWASDYVVIKEME